MSESILFRGAFVRYADIRQQDEAGVFVRIHLTADYSQPVRDAMAWPELPIEVTTAKLKGELTAQNFVLTPNERALQTHEIQFAISDVSDFQFVRTGDGDDKPYKTELRFIARSQQEGVEAIVGSYIRRIGLAVGTLKISYARQEKLDLVEQVAGKPVPLIPEASNEGQKEEAGALASAVQMAGNSAELKRRRRSKTTEETKPSAVVEWRTQEEIDGGVPFAVDLEA